MVPETEAVAFGSRNWIRWTYESSFVARCLRSRSLEKITNKVVVKLEIISREKTYVYKDVVAILRECSAEISPCQKTDPIHFGLFQIDQTLTDHSLVRFLIGQLSS